MVDLKSRTKQFALRIIRLYSALPKRTVAQVIGKQLLRAGTLVGAHYREGIHSRSNAEFISKIEVGIQELEETRYWMELIVESKLMKQDKINDLIKEATELIAILTTCVKNVKKKDD